MSQIILSIDILLLSNMFDFDIAFYKLLRKFDLNRRKFGKIAQNICLYEKI